MLLHGRYQTAHTLSLLVLPHQVQGLCSRDFFDCWLISCFSSVVHLLNTLRNQHSSNTANRTAKSSLKRHHRRHGLLPPRHPRHLLLLILILPRSHGPFHCGLVSFFFSVVHLPRMQMDIDAAAYGHLFHLWVRFFCNNCYLFVRVKTAYLNATTSSISGWL
ncbi:hypothetical protein DEU56DRAFT_817416 [Suillus clintonianus]|uniref:uncharacterized protein n=1 Tax=Suillus clintonianus TaxID=1904413 RepID=UPI001B864395|nr:uncharacterized protein DEU56DRAFT_817416 [Suillus clintonianus]KAG2129497.1 hypothetical protein DEU56DRAFT_817416 [Suillus clintonianus]